MWPTGGRRAKCLFITLLRRFDGTRGKQTRAHSLPREEKRGEFERELLMRLDLKYKFSAICNLVPARFLWDSRTRLKARHPLAWGGGKRCLFRGLVVLEQLWYIIGLPRNVIFRVTDGTLSTIHGKKIPSSCISIFNTRLVFSIDKMLILTYTDLYDGLLYPDKSINKCL